MPDLSVTLSRNQVTAVDEESLPLTCELTLLAVLTLMYYILLPMIIILMMLEIIPVTYLPTSVFTFRQGRSIFQDARRLSMCVRVMLTLLVTLVDPRASNRF